MKRRKITTSTMTLELRESRGHYYLFHTDEYGNKVTVAANSDYNAVAAVWDKQLKLDRELSR